jgi:hypothetical protein
MKDIRKGGTWKGNKEKERDKRNLCFLLYKYLLLKQLDIRSMAISP